MNCKVNWQGEDINDWIDIGKQRYNTNQFLKFMGIYLGEGSSLDWRSLVAAMKEQVPEKSIPEWVKELPAYRLEYLLEGLMASDKETFSKRLADDIQEVMFKLGTVAIVKSAFGGNYSVYKVRQSEVLPEISPKTHKTVDYVGMVYDVTVPNHIIFVRRNGKAVWSGNCWEGHITLEFSNTTPLPAKIYANEGVAQVLFLGADEVCEISYKDRGGKYQGQTGVTLPKA